MKKVFALLFSVLFLLVPTAQSKADYGEYLKNLGYEISESFSVSEIEIPTKFDAVYENYNELQKETGFDLLEYSGKECKIYSYDIYNHPFGRCKGNIIVFNGKIIGGDISSVSLSGFMTGLE